MGEANQLFAKIAMENEDVYIFNPIQYFCDENQCSAIQNDKMLYRDEGHLNLTGADYISRFFTFRLGGGDQG